MASSPFPTPIRHVIVLFMEDQAVADVLANGSFERYLATHYAFAGQYYGLTSDSVANYRVAASGWNSNGSATTPDIPSLVDNAGETWAAYEQSMPTNCDQTSTYANTTLPSSVVGDQTNHLVYDIGHDPFVNLQNITANHAFCAAHVLNLNAWTTALQTNDLPNYVWITPNDTNNDHHCPPASCPGAIPHGDAWLRSFLNPFLNSTAFSDSALFLTFDYDSTEHTAFGDLGHVYFAAISPYSKDGFTSTISYTHYNLVTTTEWLLGLGRTGHNDNWATNPPMEDLFDFANSYPVTYSESGLPTGTNWSVTMNGNHSYSTTNSIVFSVRNGSYSFSVAPVVGFTANPTGGKVVVAGAAVNQTITFTAIPPRTFAVAFEEAGLGVGVSWGVTLNGSSQNTTSPSLQFLEPNGSYAFSVQSIARYSAVPASGEVIVAGSNPMAIDIRFESSTPQSYAVIFTESDLPTPTNWSVALNGSVRESTTATIVFDLENGTYEFTIGAVQGFLADPLAGDVTVLGASQEVGIAFAVASPLFPITFSQTGLPFGTNWSVTLNGTTRTSEGIAIIFLVANGSWAYSVGSVASYDVSPSSGTVAMNGTQSYVYLDFSPTGGGPTASSTPAWAPYGVGLELVGLVAVVALAIWVLWYRGRPPGSAREWKAPAPANPPIESSTMGPPPGSGNGPRTSPPLPR